MKTALFDRHVNLGAKIVDFAGYEMPIQYHGILQEHMAVRENAGVFDVSHMGRVSIAGPEALKYVDYLFTNKIKGNNVAVYGCFCNEQGGTVDDVLLYKEDDTHFFVILNAGRKHADLAHMQALAQKFQVTLTPHFEDGIIALQGPESFKYYPDPSLKPMRFKKEGSLFISATGYTGSGGVEFFGPALLIAALWDDLIAKGVQPVGLGARDTLRLEKGYALYGHELSETISPLESVSAWTVHLEKEFLGKSHIKGQGRHMYGLAMEGSPIPREGFKVFDKDSEIGVVTSGGFSPSLKNPIALILCKQELPLGKCLSVEIRGKPFLGVVVPLPFI